MEFPKPKGVEKPMLQYNWETKPASIRPADMDLKLKIQQEREFQIARALNEGHGQEVFEINRLPDAHFIKLIQEREKNQ